MRFAHFFAEEVDQVLLDQLFEQGWRRFGIYYFRPYCVSCVACTPIRIPVDEFKCSKSQRRSVRKNSDISVSVGPRRFKPEIYEMYYRHSMARFGRADTPEQFLEGFYLESSQALQSNYFLASKLCAVGFLDLSKNGLSSSYFIYLPELIKRGLGIFSIVQEIDIARKSGLSSYYLGYWVKGCDRMTYKTGFFPSDTYSWATGSWSRQPSHE